MTIDGKGKYATFFCGYGGSCSGAEAAGLECAIAIDNNDADDNGEERLPAIQTRNKNIGDGRGVVMDIAKYVPTANHCARFVLASPPCKRFSTAAESIDQMRGKTEDEDDEDGLEEMDKNIKELGFISLDKALQIPGHEYYIMENVKGLLSSSNKPYLDEMVRRLRLKGYNAEWQIYNAYDFGACQQRERLFLIASKSGRENLLPTVPKGVKKKTFEDIMETEDSKESKERIKHARWNASTYLTAMAKQDRGAAVMKMIVPSLAQAAKVVKEGKTLASLTDVMPTVACNAGGGPTRKKWMIATLSASHPFRNATLLEGLRAQDHPDKWLKNLPGNDSQSWNMIGNAVPRCLMAGILRHLLALDKFYEGAGPRPDSCLSLDESFVIHMADKKFQLREERKVMPDIYEDVDA